MAPDPLAAIDGVSKNYGGLRPLRIQQLIVQPLERVALVGFDRPAAEVFVNLITGQALPEDGTITVLGQPTHTIKDSAAWLSFVDRFGIMSERAVLLGGLSAIENLAMPFTLSLDRLSDDVRAAAEGLARDVGLAPELWMAQVGTFSPFDAMRVRLGRALALGPAVLLLEHVSAGFTAAEAAALAAAVIAAAARRGSAVVALTVDEQFARAVAQRVLKWEPATGRLAERRGWFGGRLG